MRGALGFTAAAAHPPRRMVIKTINRLLSAITCAVYIYILYMCLPSAPTRRSPVVFKNALGCIHRFLYTIRAYTYIIFVYAPRHREHINNAPLQFTVYIIVIFGFTFYFFTLRVYPTRLVYIVNITQSESAYGVYNIINAYLHHATCIRLSKTPPPPPPPR